MNEPEYVIVDDFYDDPDEVRRHALGLHYAPKTGATYPGREAHDPEWDWKSAWDRLAAHIGQPVSSESEQKRFLQGKFRIAVAEDENRRKDGVHQDIQPWSGVVYLSRPEHCHGQSAIGFYRHIETGQYSQTPEWWLYVALKLQFDDVSAEERERRFWAYMRDKREWEEIDRVDNRYNRAVVLHAHCFHGSIGLFGTDISNGRLSQHFEFFSRSADPASNSG
jgi:hypothetical protein